MGSSFAAGPGVTRRAEGSPPQCTQSRDNYPRQVARALRLRLIDRSCGGATTRHVLVGGQFGLPAQMDGLTPNTRLVTVTIGGNDIRYLADILATSCRHRPEVVSAAVRSLVCSTPADFQLETAFADLAVNMRAIAAEVYRRSPAARLVFVDYVTVLPSAGTCAALPMSSAEAQALSDRAARLDALTAEVAAETHSGLIRASALTRSHDLCSSAPWVQGFVSRASPSDWGAAGFHPTLPAMTAVAEAIIASLEH
jgi:hypothetical protein